MIDRFSAHQFSGWHDLTFSPEDYSRFKFGADSVAAEYGTELAERLFAQHKDVLMKRDILVFASPYNHVQNAASILTLYFVKTLNRLLIEAGGQHVETSVIHRNVTYVNDYGHLAQNDRKALLSRDTFYINRAFLGNKLLLFVDDIRITGTHEQKLRRLISEQWAKNDCMFLYYAEMTGNGDPKIESELNEYYVKSVSDLCSLVIEENGQHRFLVRPIKFLMAQSEFAFRGFITWLSSRRMQELYDACLGEGYYKVPEYKNNFNALADEVNAVLTNE